MKEIASNGKYVLSLVDPDEVFDILGNGDGSGLFCRILKGSCQKATHELKSLTVANVKSYIEKAKDNNPNEFIIFYRVTEDRNEDPMLVFTVDGIKIKLSREDIWRAEQTCTGSCDLTTYCPFFGKPNIENGAGCRRIFDAYSAGQYMVSNGIFEEDDE